MSAAEQVAVVDLISNVFITGKLIQTPAVRISLLLIVIMNFICFYKQSLNFNKLKLCLGQISVNKV